LSGLRGDAVSGDAVSGDAVSGDAVSGDAVSGDAVSGDAVSGDAVSGDAVTRASWCAGRQASSGTRVGVDLVSVCLRKNAGMANRIQIPAIRPTSAEMKAIMKAPPMYQCGQNGISQDV